MTSLRACDVIGGHVAFVVVVVVFVVVVVILLFCFVVIDSRFRSAGL